MTYGIFNHGPIKSFLTRGPFRRTFQPLLYSPKDKFHYTFVECLEFQLQRLPTSVEKVNLKSVAYWLCHAPKDFFEMLFLSNEGEHNIHPIPILQGKIENYGNECAYVTQAFILCNLEQILINDKDYREKFNLSVLDLEILTHDSLIGRNSIIKHLNRYRKLSSSKNLDPRDVYLIYIWDICDILIPNPEERMKIMGCWDDDTVGKMGTIHRIIDFFVHAKRVSLK